MPDSFVAMNTIKQRVHDLDWNTINRDLHSNGFVIVRNVLSVDECAALVKDYEHEPAYRKTINMERYRFGLGEYKYYQYPLPPLITELRSEVYPCIVPVANKWMEELNIPTRFSATHLAMLKLCHDNNQTKPTALILKYAKGGFNTLHQDLYGAVYFPMQMVFMLSQVNEDYTGGEFVITEQIPRAQSKANVLQPNKGDMIIFTTQFRPQKGAKGYYRVNVRHGVSPLHTGSRYSLGIIFHDAKAG